MCTGAMVVNILLIFASFQLKPILAIVYSFCSLLPFQSFLTEYYFLSIGVDPYKDEGDILENEDIFQTGIVQILFGAIYKMFLSIDFPGALAYSKVRYLRFLGSIFSSILAKDPLMFCSVTQRPHHF